MKDRLLHWAPRGLLLSDNHILESPTFRITCQRRQAEAAVVGQVHKVIRPHYYVKFRLIRQSLIPHNDPEA